MATPTPVPHSSPLCTIPVDVLEKQLMIDSVEYIIVLVGLFVLTLASYIIFYAFTRKKALDLFIKSACISAITIVLLLVWWMTSPIISTVLTNLTNPEYASLLKYAHGCPEALK